MERSSGIKCGPSCGGRSALVPLTLAGGVAGGTLRGAAGIVMTVGTLRDGAVHAGLCHGAATEWVVPWRMVMSCWSTALWLLVSRASRELTDGLCNAIAMS